VKNHQLQTTTHPPTHRTSMSSPETARPVISALPARARRIRPRLTSAHAPSPPSCAALQLSPATRPAVPAPTICSRARAGGYIPDAPGFIRQHPGLHFQTRRGILTRHAYGSQPESLAAHVPTGCPLARIPRRCMLLTLLRTMRSARGVRSCDGVGGRRGEEEGEEGGKGRGYGARRDWRSVCAVLLEGRRRR